MSRVYFPTSSQLKRINEHLKTIAGTMGAEVDVSTWEGVQKIVRMGLAPTVFPIGTQLSANRGTYGECVFEVVAHDYLKDPYNENAPTMTLMTRDVILAMQFDERETFYHADSELSAGTYCFTLPTAYSSWAAGTYSFTLSNALPKGGVLGINGNASTPLTSLSVTAYVDRTFDFSSELVSISSGGSGISLGTFGVELNHVSRVAYGSDNYKESALRQYLNSSKSTGNVWSPQTKYDRPPSWVKVHAGFLTDFDDDFISVIGTVAVPCSANNIFESQDSTVAKGEKYILHDKFYPASQQEVIESSTGIVGDDSRILPYYEGAINADRIKYRTNSPAAWRLRTPVDAIGNNVRLVHTDGRVLNDFANLAYGCAPMCTIV